MKTELKERLKLNLISMIKKLNMLNEYLEALELDTIDDIKDLEDLEDLENINFNKDGVYCEYIDSYFSDRDDALEVIEIYITGSKDNNLLKAFINRYAELEDREHYFNHYDGTAILVSSKYENINIVEEINDLKEEIEEQIEEFQNILNEDESGKIEILLNMLDLELDDVDNIETIKEICENLDNIKDDDEINTFNAFETV